MSWNVHQLSLMLGQTYKHIKHINSHSFTAPYFVLSLNTNTACIATGNRGRLLLRSADTGASLHKCEINVSYQRLYVLLSLNSFFFF